MSIHPSSFVWAFVLALMIQQPWERSEASTRGFTEPPLYEDSSYEEEWLYEPPMASQEVPFPSYDKASVECVAEAIYFEARGEPVKGQVAVAQVIVNRARHKRYPSTPCEVVRQNDHKMNKCQFSYRCDGKPEHIRKDNNPAYTLAVSVSECVLQGRCAVDKLDQATMYYACDGKNGIPPPSTWDWTKLKKANRLSNHCFFVEV